VADLRSAYDAPFSGRVSFEDVAERIRAHDLGDTPEAMRAAFARLVRGAAAGTPPPFATPATWGGVDGLTVAPPDVDADTPARVVWFHGGGYVFGSPETHARAAAALATRLDEPVFLPRYRLAPEHVWPAQRDDALAVVRALQGSGRVVALVGDSAGGHLALVAALALARSGAPPVALTLLSPNTDRTGLSDTREANTPHDPMNADDDDRELAERTFGDRPDGDLDVSPVLGDLSPLPPTHVEVGDREVLLGDARILARRGRAAGAEVTLHVEAGAFHMWQLWTPWLPEADASLDRVAAFLRHRLAA
jgi:acetyl esterase/lipase